MLRTYTRLALVPAALATGCPDDDTSVTASADSSGSSGGETTSATQTTASTSATTSISTSEADTSSSGTTDAESSSTDATNASSESSSGDSTNASSESSSTGAELCGNGVIDAGEDCEGTDLGGTVCADIGYDAGELACNVACHFDVFNCIIFICGNNSIDPTEFCDGTDLAGADCVSEGFPLGGELGCNVGCSDYDTSSCLTQLCGNDNIEGTEACDGTDLSGQSCASLGFAGGQLGCTASCMGYSTGGCTPGGSQFTYVVNDTSPNSITAYAVASDGVLTELAGSPFDTGGNSSFNHHPDAIVNCGAYLYAANNGSGDISAFFVEADGSLTTVAGSPFAQPDAVSLACAGDYLFASTDDDNVWRFSIAADGSLSALGSVAAQASTRGMTVNPTANHLFVAGLDSAINVYDIDGAGNLTAVAGSPFTHAGSNHSASVSPDGTFVASEGIAGVRVWSVAGNGALAEVAGSPFADTSGCEVVGLAWAPDGQRLFVGHRSCAPGVISVYDVSGSGALAEVAGSPFPSGGDDTVGLAVAPLGNRLFASHIGSNSTSVLEIGDSGALVPVAGSPFPNGVGGNHSWIALRGGGMGSCQTPFGAPSYDEVFTFTDPMLDGTRMTMAWDGAEYWASAGGFASTNLGEIDETGASVAIYNPGFDIRSVFAKGDGVGPIYLRAYNDAQIHVQTSPGVFSDDVFLAGGLDDQAAVVWDDLNDYFLLNSYGSITRWDAAGAVVDSVVLSGFGSMGSESAYPQGRGLAWACGYFYTYSDGILSAWDETGNRVATTTLNGAGTSFDSYFAYSVANGMFFVLDTAGGTWRGYDAI